MRSILGNVLEEIRKGFMEEVIWKTSSRSLIRSLWVVR